MPLLALYSLNQACVLIKIKHQINNHKLGLVFVKQLRKANQTDANIKKVLRKLILTNQKLAAETCSRYQAPETSLEPKVFSFGFAYNWSKRQLYTCLSDWLCYFEDDCEKSIC